MFFLNCMPILGDCGNNMVKIKMEHMEHNNGGLVQMIFLCKIGDV